MTLSPRTVRPRPPSSRSVEASPPPRCTWNTYSSPMYWPLSPMSAVWMRAHEFGQPLMCREMGVGISTSARRSSMSSITRAARPLVSTNASLQNSMPVHAMVERRNGLGFACSPRGCTASISPSTVSSGTSSTSTFWCGVRRMRWEPAASAASARATSASPESRPAVSAKPTYRLPSTCSCTPTWSEWPTARSGAGPSGSSKPRYSSCSTFRNFSGPHSASRNFRRALVRCLR